MARRAPIIGLTFTAGFSLRARRRRFWGPIEPVRQVIREVGVGAGMHYRMPRGRLLAEQKRYQQELASFGIDA
jgi:hypothetical protein